MDIRCRKRQCKYNDRFTCRAKDISVSEKSKEVEDTTQSLFSKTPDYAPQRDSKTMTITCRANCLFNRNGKCVSNGITLNAIKEKPYCVSFLKK